MLNKKSFIILFLSLIIVSLAGCGGEKASFDVPTRSGGAQLVSISVALSLPLMAPGTRQQGTATGLFSDNTTKDLTSSVYWESSDVNVVEVVPGIEAADWTGSSASAGNDSPGSITSNGTGSARITANWGNISGSTDVTVSSATLMSIVITPTTTKMLTGTTRQLTATGTFSDNTVQDVTTTVTWSSDILAVAAVGNDPGSKGQANAIAAGETMITATSGDVSGTVLLHVIEGALVTLLWDAPTTNTDGSPLNPVTELSTYKIYYGPASHMYTAVVSIQNPGTTTISQALELPLGTYYFAVTTVDAAGQESDYSNELMKTI